MFFAYFLLVFWVVSRRGFGGYYPPMFEILVIVIDSMCGDPILDLLYLAIPTVLLGAGAFILMGKDNRKKIEEIFR